MSNFYAAAAKMVGDPAAAGYPGLIWQLAYAVRQHAATVLADAKPGDDSPSVALARRAYLSPEAVAQTFMWPVVGNAAVRTTMQAMDPIKDEDVLWIVSDQWSTVAAQA